MIHNHFLFYRYSFEKGLFSPLFFSWALFGLILLTLAEALFSRQRKEKIRELGGIKEGLLQEIRGKKSE